MNEQAAKLRRPGSRIYGDSAQGYRKATQNGRRSDAVISLSLVVVVVVSRVPFRSQILYHWDSVNFAYAMRQFDVAREQPQPPGYIVYVWLCRLVDLVFNDPQTTMVVISIVSSGLAVAAMFYLGRKVFDRRIGLIAALLLAFSPLFWFYGEIALPHALDTLLVIASVWCLYETTKGDYRYLYLAVAIVAIAGGVRQQTLVFLLPLLLFALRRVGWRRFLAAGILGAVICTMWFVPLMVNSGGVGSYLRSVGEFTRRFQDTTSILMGAGWSGIRYNVRKLTMYTVYGWSAAMVPAMVYAVGEFSHLRWARHASRRHSLEKPVFLILWVVPSFGFYAAIHMGQQGLILVFLPVLFVISAVGMARMLADRPRWLMAATAGLVAINAAVFLVGPEYPLGPGNQRLLTRETLRNADRYYQERFDAIAARFPASSTLVVAADWHHVAYYLPGYGLLPVDLVPGDGVDGHRLIYREGRADGYRSIFREREMEAVSARDLGLTPRVDGTFKMVVFDPDLAPLLSVDRPEAVDTIDLPYSGQLTVLIVREGARISLGPTVRISGP